MSAIGAYRQRVQGLQRNVKRYLACTGLQSIAMSLSSLLFNFYLVSIGLDATFIGLNSAVLSGTRMVCALPAGLIADRVGRKRSLFLGLAGMAVAQFGMATLESRWLILASSVLSGALGALYITSGAPFLIENSTREQRAVLFTLDSSLTNIASSIAATAGGYLPGIFAGLLHVGPESAPAYRGVMLIAAGAMALALLPILAIGEQRGPMPAPGRGPRRPRARSSPLLWRRVSNPRLMVRLILPRALMACGAGLVFPFLNLFFKQRFGVSDATLGWIFGITSVLAALVMMWGGTVAERLGKVQAAFYAQALSVPWLLIIGFVPSLPAAVLAHWTRSGLMRLGEPLYIAFAMEQLSADERAMGSSLLAIGWSVGWSAGPYVSGLLQPRTGWGPLFLGTIAFYTASLACVYFFFMRHQAGPSLRGAAHPPAEPA